MAQQLIQAKTDVPRGASLVCSMPGDSEASRWVADLQEALGNAVRVSDWTTGAQQASDTELAVVWKPDQAFADAHPQLKYVFCIGAGVDALLRLRWPDSVQIVRLEDPGMGEQMAEYVSYGVLRFFRGFDLYERQAEKNQWKPLEPLRKNDWPVGILGFGVLAKPVARTLQQLGFPVHAWTRTRKEGASVQTFAGEAGLPAFLASTRVLVCMLPLTADTRRLLRSETFALLPRGAYVINVARGGHVDQLDLIEALDSGQLSGALLDVCEPEPLPADHPLWRHPKIRLTPHVAAATLRDEAVSQIVGKLRALQRGEVISGIVTARGY